ncbi:hypothetical protein CALCODRAFT_444796 [Calocera cornea HHB12733]|uniref:Integrase core domain-containing protein n=1 Tax=Calocera cornea HHB12733 TaxID=1353952 RepID=A0A165C6M7_9BASI|nr:hypothetical protein CALCODRAFT_444796 [Calocera cornea HHB12733]
MLADLYGAVPDSILRPLVEKYYTYGYGDKKILEAITRDVELEQNGWTLSTKTIQRRRKEWGLLSVKQQGHTLETIAPYVEQLRVQTANRLGSRSMRDFLRSDNVLLANTFPRQLISQYQSLTDPIGNRQRRGKRLKHYHLWTAGLHEFWSFDQHDKWKRFGLFLHVGLENFSNTILWLKVWWTNSNPRLIASYYFEAAKQLHGIPLLTQSDPGTENNGIANAQTTLRRHLDPSLEDTLQHQWMRGHANIKPEIFWSKLRRQWSQGWESLFQEGLDKGYYVPAFPAEALLFRWMAIPLVQRDLDRYAHIHNTSRPRKNDKKKMPTEIPYILMEHPEVYGPYHNYKVTISKELVDQVALEFAPLDHPVFELVPDAFRCEACRVYEGSSCPPVNRSTFWRVYTSMLNAFKDLPNANAIQEEAFRNEQREATIGREFMEVLPGRAARGPALMGLAAEDEQEDQEGEEVRNGENNRFSPDGNEDDLSIYTLTQAV